jgi:thiol:disulfide interchange protein DsbA
MKRALLIAISIGLAALAGPALSTDLQAGKHYTVISTPQPTSVEKIEVVEFFSYACPYCREFHPVISDWSAKLPKDVTLRKVHVTFGRPEWARLAKIYYALEASGNLAKLDNEVFKAVHDERIRFANDDAVVKWVASKGGDAQKFSEAFASAGIQSQVDRGAQEADAYKVRAVPAMGVDGRFLMKSDAASDYSELLLFTDHMTDQVRAEKNTK